ncbi:MAG: GNAT family N-acetyltransferase [Verrucomicrobia bacterium]|nr:MAG: GNAT family N-acetyltransferase [Verrucomicrobiota bacterium]
MSDLRYRVLDWDSQWFGIPIGRADLPKITAASAAAVDAWARRQGLKCVYVFEENGIQANESFAGFKPMDIRVEYELDPAVLAKGPSDASFSMRPDEQEAVCSLARQLFTATRFSRDAGFPPARVRELYAEWVRRDSAGCVPGCRVIRADNEIIGFVTGRTDSTDATRGSIGLLGVAEAYRGRGLGAKLLDYVCRAFVKTGVKRVTVVTQEINTAACHLYEHGGHVIARGCWYHRWYDDAGSGSRNTHGFSNPI